MPDFEGFQAPWDEARSAGRTTDEPTPGWWRILDDKMAAGETRGARRSIAVNYPNELYALVLEASRQRNISMTAFQRRAALAVAEHDLQFDWLDTMLAEPPVGSFVRPGSGIKSDGLGFGPWHIIDLAEHAITDADADGD